MTQGQVKALMAAIRHLHHAQDLLGTLQLKATVADKVVNSLRQTQEELKIAIDLEKTLRGRT